MSVILSDHKFSRFASTQLTQVLKPMDAGWRKLLAGVDMAERSLRSRASDLGGTSNLQQCRAGSTILSLVFSSRSERETYLSQFSELDGQLASHDVAQLPPPLRSHTL